MVELSELQHDALVEIINIGMGKAAHAMSTMVDDEIQLSVPSINFLSTTEAKGKLHEIIPYELSAISQGFQGTISGEAILLFPSDKSLEIVRLILKADLPLDELTELEKEALSEIGNIILNAGLSSLADALKTELQSSLPKVKQRNTIQQLFKSDASIHDIIMLLRVDFIVKSKQIDGYVLYVLDIDSIENLRTSLDNFLQLP